jgi:hypothetical protein
MIRVPAEVRDRLAAVAEARGISLRALMREIAAQPLNPEHIKERADRTRTLLAERFGHHVTDEESVLALSRIEHYVLDSPTLLTMVGNEQVSGHLHAAASSDDMRLWMCRSCASWRPSGSVRGSWLTRVYCRTSSVSWTTTTRWP